MKNAETRKYFCKKSFTFYEYGNQLGTTKCYKV